ncbi:MAG: pyridoxamine 5'-phosphate oxidase family protein [Phycisphaerales bacterium]|nr:MAG: pyridoxamine 5'-phosphate oxidase family protein [Phycisphaerales bacterium]
MDTQQARRFVLGLMDVSPAAYLTTIGPDRRPYTRAMLNLRNRKQYPRLVELFAPHNEALLIYFTTNTSSGKVQQVRANPAVCVYYCEPEKFHGAMLGGDVEIVDDAKVRESLWQDGWEMYYPGGPNDPDHTVLRLAPAFAQGWHGEGSFEFRVSE